MLSLQDSMPEIHRRVASYEYSVSSVGMNTEKDRKGPKRTEKDQKGTEKHVNTYYLPKRRKHEAECDCLLIRSGAN